MIYIDGYTADEWSKKYGIDIEEMKCCSCKKVFKTTVPIRIKGYAGLEMPEHGCPKNRLGATFTPISEKERSFWDNIIGKPNEQ